MLSLGFKRANTYFKPLRMCSASVVQTCQKSGMPFNTVILFVPQQEAWVVERFGKFHRILQPGLNLILPFVDSIKYLQPLKELTIDIPRQSAITADNVALTIDGMLNIRVKDPYKASYGIEDAEYAITQLAQTCMRSEIGRITLDTVFSERNTLNRALVESINKAAEAWGIDVLRYEIRDLIVPQRIQEAMQMVVEADRKKRASILQSEGEKTAEINIADGKRAAKVLASEAIKQEQINIATGQAEAILRICEALGNPEGKNAVSVKIAEQYIDAFGKLAKQSNSIILPANTGDVSSMVAQALTIYKSISLDTSKKPDSDVKSGD